MPVMKRKIILWIIAILILTGTAFVGVEFYISKYWLETTHYTLRSDRISRPFRVVQLTDLHDSEFGEGNSKLISDVVKEKPDVILITGDLVNNKTGEDTSIAANLITGLAEIAPVYFSYGNHEKALEENHGVDIRKLFTDAGATVLEREYLDITVNGQELRLGGIYGYCLPDRYAQENRWEDESAYLKEFQDTDQYTILMCHLPLCWLTNNSLYDWNIDSVFAGHDHGGQVRIPFVGGLWAPDQGWLPGREYGIYSTEEKKWNEYKEKVIGWMQEPTFDVSYYKDVFLNSDYKPGHLILSRGLGNTDSIPRFNNIPEIVVVDFMPGEILVP